MKNTVYKMTAAIIFVMFVIPFITVKVVRSDAGMAVCFILFYAVDPLLSAVIGWLSANDFKNRWFMPIVNAAAFLISTWILFEMGEIAFVIYSLMYLGVGYAFAFISFALRKLNP